MKKLWIVPLIILALLSVAWVFRWDYEATKTYPNGIAKWKTDRWTNLTWVEIYSNSGTTELPVHLANKHLELLSLDASNVSSSKWKPGWNDKQPAIPRIDASEYWGQRHLFTKIWAALLCVDIALFIAFLILALRKPKEGFHGIQ